MRGSRLYFLPELDSCSKRCLFSLESPPQSHCPTQLPSLLPSPTLCFCFSLGHSAGNSFPLIHTFHPQFFFLNIHKECDHILKPSVPKCHFLGDVPPKRGISHSLLGHPHAADNAVPWQAHSGTSCEGLWTSTCSLQGHISHHPQMVPKTSLFAQFSLDLQPVWIRDTTKESGRALTNNSRNPPALLFFITAVYHKESP